MFNRICASVILVGLATAPGLLAADRKVALKDLPPVVREAILKETARDTLKGLSAETEGGQTTYEAETIRQGHSRDVTFDAAGAIVEIEEAMALDAAPAAVKAALEKRGRVLSLESVTHGSVVTYEATVGKNGKTSEVAVDANGAPVRK